MGITGERLVGYNIFGDKEITDLHHSFQKLLDPDNNPYRYLEAQALLQYLNRNINIEPVITHKTDNDEYLWSIKNLKSLRE